MLVRLAVLRERLRRSDLRSADLPPPIGEDRDDPWRRQLSIGHGCSGPDLATPSISALDMGPDHQEANGQIAVCVVGDGDVVVQLLERLTDIGVRVHATADTIDDYIAVKRTGVVPHRFEDMPAVAAGIDLLISTSFSRPIGATVLARLPESAVVIDLAGPPGSVDFEVAQRLARRTIWEPPVDRHFDASWRSVADQIERLEARKNG
ncbi:MAG: hypothetical protein QM576_11445 [Rhodopseudomonas sp.]|uniref:hypothetical protein n=1 Tax=Rhodopseudomonas sp. TaxID=1078 RepID=UPI0039E2E13D